MKNSTKFIGAALLILFIGFIWIGVTSSNKAVTGKVIDGTWIIFVACSLSEGIIAEKNMFSI